MRRLLSLLVAGGIFSATLPSVLAATDPTMLLGNPTPETPVTRGQAVVYLYEQFREEIEQDSSPAPSVNFMDVPADSPLLPVLSKFCVAEAVSCTGGDFLPDQPASMPAILKMYDKLLHHYRQVPLTGLPAEKLKLPNWNEEYMSWGQERGLIPGGMLMVPVTTVAMQQFLAKDAYLDAWHYALPSASPELPKTMADINDTKITTKDGVHTLQGLVDRAQNDLNGRRPTLFRFVQDAEVSGRLAALEIGLKQLDGFMDEHPLYYDGSFSEEERAEFRKLGLQEIIGVGEYDFRTNPSYRKHNIRATLKHIHKMVLQPDEEFNYWNLMYTKGMDDVVNGWLIVEGEEVWGWGGGLCGTATAIFRGAWFAGLEITERRPHTNYYNSLYGRDMGLDATVYQDSPNLRFKNNTGHPLMLYLRYNETQDDAKVMVLGTKHFTGFEFVKGVRRGRSINHTRILTLKDGSKVTDDLFSSYKKVE